jgi:hypothetical protein
LLVGDAARGGDKKQKNTREFLISLLFDVKRKCAQDGKNEKKNEESQKAIGIRFTEYTKKRLVERNPYAQYENRWIFRLNKTAREVEIY